MSKTGKELKAKRLAAFENTISEYETALLRYAARIVGSPAAAEDVVQDTFVRLFRNWKDELRPSPQVSSWLYRVAHNLAVDYLRKESRRRLLHFRDAEDRARFQPPNRGAGFRVGEAAALAVSCLKQLSLREQQLVILKIYEEKSYREISEITGLTVTNVGYILHHAMKKMAEEFKKARPANP